MISHNGEVIPVVQIERRFKTTFRLNDINVDERIIEDHFQPIPLNPEWLQRCGFAESFRDKLGKSWTIDIMPSAKRVLGICNMTTRTLVSFVSEPGNIVMLRPIYNVHQLQNLYFALTGEELAITQPVT